MTCASAAVPPTTPAGLYRRLSGFVRRSLGWHGVRESDLDDLTQEVFVVMHRKRPRLDDDRTARSWLHEAAKRVASNDRRARARARNREPSWEPGTPPTPEEALAWRRTTAAIEAFETGLGPDARAVFRLNTLEGHSAPEVARRLGLKLNTTYSHIRRVRHRLARTAAIGLGVIAVLVSMLGTCTAQASDDHRRLHPVRAAADVAR